MRNDLLTLEALALKQAVSLTITNRRHAGHPIIFARVRTIITELVVAAEVARVAWDMARDDADLVRARDVVAEQCERAIETLGAVLADVSAPETDTLH